MRLGRKTAAERERLRIEADELHRRMRESVSLPDPAPEPPACELHPAWQPDRRGPQPRLPRIFCPFCQREEAERREEKRAKVEVQHPLNTRDVGRLSSAWERVELEYEERLVRAGQVVAGSDAEHAALERIAELRDAEQERQQAKGRRNGRVAFQRIEAGQVVTYFVPPRRGRKGELGLVRVAP
jgi:uncharacterized Zn finger protein (UPF0148 family)